MTENLRETTETKIVKRIKQSRMIQRGMVAFALTAAASSVVASEQLGEYGSTALFAGSLAPIALAPIERRLAVRRADRLVDDFRLDHMRQGGKASHLNERTDVTIKDDDLQITTFYDGVSDTYTDRYIDIGNRYVAAAGASINAPTVGLIAASLAEGRVLDEATTNVAIFGATMLAAGGLFQFLTERDSKKLIEAYPRQLHNIQGTDFTSGQE